MKILVLSVYTCTVCYPPKFALNTSASFLGGSNDTRLNRTGFCSFMQESEWPTFTRTGIPS